MFAHHWLGLKGFSRGSLSQKATPFIVWRRAQISGLQIWAALGPHILAAGTKHPIRSTAGHSALRIPHSALEWLLCGGKPVGKFVIVPLQRFNASTTPTQFPGTAMTLGAE